MTSWTTFIRTPLDPSLLFCAMKKILTSVFLLTFLAGGLQADFSDSMKARLGDLVAAKDAGSIGEGVDGYVHLRDSGNAAARKLVDAENADRKKLFISLAGKTGGTVQAVAGKFSKALASKAKAGHWFRESSGVWVKK